MPSPACPAAEPPRSRCATTACPATDSPPLGRLGFRATDDGALAVGQPASAATWFPVNDHPCDKATYAVTPTVPAGLQAVSNGLPGRTVTRSGCEKIGDDAFFTVLRRWAARHRDGDATTSQLVTLAEQGSGRPLDALFHAWLYAPTAPAGVRSAAAGVDPGQRAGAGAWVERRTVRPR